MELLASLRPTTYTTDRSALSRQIINLAREAKNFGVRLKYNVDFDHFREVVQAIPDRGAVTPVFDTRCSDIGPDNGFWVNGVDEAGQTVHVQAVRFDDLTGTNLAYHWRAQPKMYGPPGLEIDIEMSRFETAPVTYEISGRVCYHGDFWISKEHRRLGLSAKLSAFSMLLGLSRFSPDYIYCFITPRLIKRGLSTQYGFLHIHPWAPRWHITGEAEPYDDYFVWVTGRELAELWTSGERDVDFRASINKADHTRPSIVEDVARQ